MLLQDIDLSALRKYERFDNAPKPALYSSDEFYYKIIHNISPYSRSSPGYYILDGLNLVWAGCNDIAANGIGLITAESVPAFKDFIYDGDMCCGYVMHRGQPLAGHNMTREEYVRYLAFINKLSDLSVKCGYGFSSTNLDNIIDFNGELSLIDLDFSPIKLMHGHTFTDYENKVWENEFRSFNGLYLKMVKSKLNVNSRN